MAQPSNRERLIKGAIQCLQTKGFARTTARDIAAASKANLASIGYHFGSKDALLNEALSRVLMERTRQVGEATLNPEGNSPIDNLRAIFESVLGIFEKHRPLLVAFVEAMAQVERSPELRTQMAAVYREVRTAGAAMVRASLGSASGGLRSDPAVMASLMIAVFDGLVLQWLIEPGDTPSGAELVGALADTMGLALKQEATLRR